MRSKLRASVIAVSMATIMTLSVSGCAAAKTDEFNEESTPAISQSVDNPAHATDGVTDRNIIDNTGKFTYTPSNSRYNQSISDASNTGLICVGYTVYEDASGHQLSLTPLNGAAQAGQRGTNKGETVQTLTGIVCTISPLFV